MLAEAVANNAKHRSRAKYAHLVSSHFFVAAAVETMGVLREADCSLRAVTQHAEQMTRLAHQYFASVCFSCSSVG